MLTADQAATIARRHGLTLQDAASLQALADDEATAERIAGQFATADTPDPEGPDMDEIKTTLQRLFNDAVEPTSLVPAEDFRDELGCSQQLAQTLSRVSRRIASEQEATEAAEDYTPIVQEDLERLRRLDTADPATLAADVPRF